MPAAPAGRGERWLWMLARLFSFAFAFVVLGYIGSWLATAAGLAQFPGIRNAVVLLAAIGAGLVPLRWLDHRPARALGFGCYREAWRETALGFLVGTSALGLAVLLLVLTGAAHWVPDRGTAIAYGVVLIGSLGFFWVAAALEEALFRGYLFQALTAGIGPWPATMLASALFAAAHFGNPGFGVFAFANIFLAGVMLSVAYLRTRSLWLVTALHLGWNWTMSALLDFPVSGLVRDTPLYTAVETGADAWTGGRFGPEAGAAATIAIVLATAYLLRSPLWRPAAATLRARPLVDDFPSAPGGLNAALMASSKRENGLNDDG